MSAAPSPNAGLTLTLDDLTLTQNAESCIRRAYPDPASPLARRLQALGQWRAVLNGAPIAPELLKLSGAPWTIGWGYTGPEVHYGLEWTQAQCDAQLLAAMRRSEANVREEVEIPLTREEFVALCDLDFNIGNAAFDTSTLLRKLNASDFAGAIAEFARWNKAGGKVLAGLVKRRGAESALFRIGARRAGQLVEA